MTELKRAVQAIIDEQGDKDEQKTYMKDVMQHGCVSGMVGELIYYNDTHKWYDTYYADIEELREELEDSMGESLKPDGDLKNWFAWLSFEETLRAIYEEEYGTY